VNSYSTLKTLKTFNFINSSMLDFQQKRKVRAFLYHPVTLVTLFIIVVFFLHSTWVVYEKKRESEQNKNISLANVNLLRAHDVELSSRIDRLKTDSGIEEEIRSKFTVAKNNENMVIVVEEKETSASSTSQTGGFWRKLSDFFF